jgi:hypothetical protein
MTNNKAFDETIKKGMDMSISDNAILFANDRHC